LEVEVALDRATVLNTHMRAIPVFVALDGTVRVKSTGENSVIVSLSNLKAFLYEAMKDRQYKRVEIFANRNLPFHLLLKVMREIGQEGEVKILFIANEREEQ
jgi:biopolymer transport protein ExbD